MERRVVAVTGAAGGIGRAITGALRAEGYAVGGIDREEADVADPVALARALDQIEAEHGPLTDLVGAAGVLRPGTVTETTDADWEVQWRVNAGGTFHLLREAGRRLAGPGAVVIVGSNAAQVPRTGMAAYAASKAAAAALARCAGLELAARGIRCNVVEPGSTDTPMQQDLWSDPEAGRRAALDGDPASYRLGIPLGRIAEPADIAGTVAFLLSDAARHITLQRLLVDGGASL